MKARLGRRLQHPEPPNKARSARIGDVVRLRSGGPAMTVSQIDKFTPNTVICVWFISGQVQNGSFIANTVRPVEDGEQIDNTVY